ncbi:MAG TPA: hypothetical protein VNI02_02600 [Blastocatellia bacterium]|jgi:hypothetical protein|nr:hypothetical protein [Blastocatellia bacterium]
MAHSQDEERIRRYRESIARAWGFGDSNSWPVKLNAAFHLFLKEFGEELLADVDYLEQHDGYSLADVAKLFYNPARIYRIIDSVVYGMRRNRYPLAQQRQVVLKMLSMVKALKHGSEFNDDGGNIIYDPATVSAVVRDKLAARPQSIEESQLLHKFCGIMWAYTESIFFRAHDVTKEIHGPYFYDGGEKKLVVKEYLNLSPAEIWPGVTLLPCDTIKVYKIYDESVRLRIDALNHLYHEGNSLVTGLERYRVEVDGEERGLDTLREFLPIVQETIFEISSHVESIGWNDRVLKYADIFWFRKKPLRDARGLPWGVPEQVRLNILSGAEDPRRRERLSDEESQRLALLTI